MTDPLGEREGAPAARAGTSADEDHQVRVEPTVGTGSAIAIGCTVATVLVITLLVLLRVL